MTATSGPSSTQDQDPGPDLDPHDAIEDAQDSDDRPEDLREVTDPSDPSFVEPFDDATGPAGG